MALLKRILLTIAVIEVVVFILICNLIGFFPALLLTIAAMFLGGAILRHHGIQQLQGIQQQMQLGKMTSLPAAESSLVLLAGLLLLIPGFVTDIVALLMLWPRLRDKVIKTLLNKKIITPQPESNEASHRVIEGEFWREDK